MEIVSTQQRKKIHPHKFTLWVAIGSIVMMFAGLTSAYIVKSNQAAWQTIVIPKIFWYSTTVILISSLTVQMALRAFKDREMNRYRSLIAITTVLGVLFILLQYLGFRQLWMSGVTLRGSGAGQFPQDSCGFWLGCTCCIKPSRGANLLGGFSCVPLTPDPGALAV